MPCITEAREIASGQKGELTTHLLAVSTGRNTHFPCASLGGGLKKSLLSVIRHQPESVCPCRGAHVLMNECAALPLQSLM